MKSSRQQEVLPKIVGSAVLLDEKKGKIKVKIMCYFPRQNLDSSWLQQLHLNSIPSTSIGGWNVNYKLTNEWVAVGRGGGVGGGRVAFTLQQMFRQFKTARRKTHEVQYTNFATYLIVLPGYRVRHMIILFTNAREKLRYKLYHEQKMMTSQPTQCCGTFEWFHGSGTEFRAGIKAKKRWGSKSTYIRGTSKTICKFFVNPDPGFWWPKIYKKIYSWKKNIFLDHNYNLPIPRPP
jgi:hypothetical protein